jgi:hypothetical protein
VGLLRVDEDELRVPLQAAQAGFVIGQNLQVDGGSYVGLT